jgi:hypothetical protein
VTLVLPLLVFLVGSWATSAVSGRQTSAPVSGPADAAEGGKPLGQRPGYDVKAVAAYWKSLGDAGQRVEKRFLQLDLMFPFLYGGAFAAGLLVAWTHLGRPFHAGWFIVPVGITVVADWTENLVQIGQLTRYMKDGQGALQPGWVQVASAATFLKLVFGLGSVLLLFVLVAIWVGRALRPA